MKMRILFTLLLIGLTWYAGDVVNGAALPIDPALARQYLAELKRISDTDNGKLWGVRLYGPTIFVDPDSRSIVANQPDQGGQLKVEDGIYVGSLGPEINTANTATEWSGTFWTMVSWNAISDTDQYERARLLIHESWHRIQKELGIPSALTSNVYLDGINGRVFILLEFRGLSRALLASDKSERREAIADALIIRQNRQSQFPQNNENAFERHEGMAEYTGLKLCGLPDSLLIRIAARKLKLGESNDGLANSFPYLTGPAIGLLLDQYNADWRAEVCKGAELPVLLAAAIDWHAPIGNEQIIAAADLAGAEYEKAKLLDEETARAVLLEKTTEMYRNRLLTHERLVIPNNNLQFSFNPQEKLIPLDTSGVIYKTMRLSGDFGVLEVTDGILRTNDWQCFIVAAPDNVDTNPIIGEGYRLQLNPGWQIAGKTKGIFALEKK
jgi:hypothetical protein